MSFLLKQLESGYFKLLKPTIGQHGLSYLPEWSGGYELLCLTLNWRKKKEAIYLLEKGSRVNSEEVNHMTPLHWAIFQGYQEIATTLIEKGSKLNTKDNRGKTPLHLAVQNSDESMVRLLLNKGAQVNLTDDYDRTSLQLACELEIDNKIIKLLLEHKANVNYANALTKETPISVATGNGDEGLVQLLLDRGAKTENMSEVTGITPLQCAIQANDLDMFQLLLNGGAKPNTRTLEDKRTSLHIALNPKVRSEIFELLLEQDVDVNALDRDNVAPLHMAIKRRRETFIESLLVLGANVNVRAADGSTPLSLAVERNDLKIVRKLLLCKPDFTNTQTLKKVKCDLDNLEMVNTLIEYGLTFDIENIYNSKLLHRSVEKGYHKIVKSLLESGSDPNSKLKDSNCNESLLYKAIECEQVEILKLLVKHGANLQEGYSSSDAYDSPLHHVIVKRHCGMKRILLTRKRDIIINDNSKVLHLAVVKNFTEGCEILLENGFNANLTDEFGRTALHYATKAEMAELLIKHKAKVDAKSNEGLTPLHMAVRRGNTPVVSVLVEHGASSETPMPFNRATPKHLAVQYGHKEILAILMKNNCEYEDPLRDGKTPLHLAAEKHSPELIRLILGYYGDIDSQDNSGQTALHYAVRFGQLDTVKRLLALGANINLETIHGFTPLKMPLYRQEDEIIDYHDDSSEEDLPLPHLRDITNHLRFHIVKLLSARIHVSKENIEQVRIKAPEAEGGEGNVLHTAYGELRLEPILYNYSLVCGEESERIEATIVHDSITLHYIMTTNDVGFVSNEPLMGKLHSTDFKGFAEYGKLIRNKFRADERKYRLIGEIKENFNNFTNAAKLPNLPEQIITKIANSLSEQDLRNLNACIDATMIYEF